MDPCELRIAAGPRRCASSSSTRCRCSSSRSAPSSRASTSTTPRAASPACARPRPSSPASATRRCVRSTSACVSGWLALPDDEVRRAVQAAGRAQPPAARRPADASAPTVPADAAAVPRLPRPDPRDKVASVEREALKVALQAPQLAGSWVDALETDAFRSPAYVAVHRAIVAAGGAATGLGRPRVARRRARRLPRRRGARGRARARGRPAADRRGRRALRAVGDRAAARDRRLAPHHRSQGPAPAHRAGRRPRRLPGAVRRRPGARGLPPRAARAGRGRPA